MEKQDYDELERQLGIWAGAYSNILKKESERSGLMLKVMQLDDEIELEAKIQEDAKNAVNNLIEDIPEGSADYNIVQDMMQKNLAPSIIKGFVQ